MKYDIFISYRRDGGYDTAKHLYDLLSKDGYRVTFDIDTLRNGFFDEQLYERIDQCKDFILIVDKHAFERTIDPTFPREKDWMRCELSYALSKNKNVIPILLSEASFPDVLPTDIADVCKRNGPIYNKYYFNDFYKVLKKRFLSSNIRNKRLVEGIVLLFIILSVFFIFVCKRKLYVNEITKSPNVVAELYLCKYKEIDKYFTHRILKIFEYKDSIDSQHCYQVYPVFSDSSTLYHYPMFTIRVINKENMTFVLNKCYLEVLKWEDVLCCKTKSTKSVLNNIGDIPKLEMPVINVDNQIGQSYFIKSFDCTLVRGETDTNFKFALNATVGGRYSLRLKLLSTNNDTIYTPVH